MTAGQRNCYLAIEECLQRYSLDDVLFAVREQLMESIPETGLDRDERRHRLRDCVRLVDVLREMMPAMEPRPIQS